MNTQPRWIQFLPSMVVCRAATLGPLGFLSRAPGTVGSGAGLLWFTVAFFEADPLSYLLILAFSIYLAVVFCGEAEQRMFKRDPPEIILDECVAVPICFVGMQPYMTPATTWFILLCGFGLFRLFDIWKPFGIRRLQSLPGGTGVVSDDLAAACATCLTLHLVFG